MKIQGYENLFLDDYFKNGNLENDIIINNDEIENEIGILKYIDKDNKEHRYFPDFYIKNSNTIIEIM